MDRGDWVQIKIAKFQLYPKNEPAGYAVGFDITTINNRRFYIDTIVEFKEEALTDDEILTMAWEELKDNIYSKAMELENKKEVVNKNWIPPEARGDPDWDLIDGETLYRKEQRLQYWEDRLKQKEKDLGFFKEEQNNNEEGEE